MKERNIILAVLGSLIVILCLVAPAQTQPEVEARSTNTNISRSVAVTFDDLPVVRGNNLPRMQEITKKLLSQITILEMPTIGFVNERKLGEPVAEAEYIALLEQWLDAGHDLGNHTYSHPQFYNTSLADYEADVLHGEVVTNQLLEKRNRQVKYFRHPYLNTGPDLETKAAFEQFLADQSYTVAPVTIDNDEYIYALAYDKAKAADDNKLASRIGADYIRYMEEMFVFYEQLSQDLLGREPAQILLLHANALNADYLGELAGMMRERGYEFIALEMALRDSAYALPDQYIGQSGLSWLQRWWITQGNERCEEPFVSKWVKEIAYPGR